MTALTIGKDASESPWSVICDCNLWSYALNSDQFVMMVAIVRICAPTVCLALEEVCNSTSTVVTSAGRRQWQ